MRRLAAGCLLVLMLGSFAALAQGESNRTWRTRPHIVVIGAPDDPRHTLVREAVVFWNEALRALGSGFSLGRVTNVALPLPEKDLQAMSASVIAGTLARDGVPAALRALLGDPGQLTVLLGDSAFVSFTSPFIADQRRLVGIRGLTMAPLNQPNVARNLIAHELGHAIGLVHNSDSASLMCGRPAPCRPALFTAVPERYFPLLAFEEQALLQTYPAGWTARPRP